MIPLTLHIKNFLSYGPQTQQIDFEAYHLICLSGKNGHGKSALLDALTWALWGQARKITGTAKSDDVLLHTGQQTMFVIAEVQVHQTRYRIRREYSSITNKSFTVLDFGVIDPISNCIRSLTDKTIRATQEKIISTIGLDYETFINSVFLRQGQSNEFSKKTPKERKDILASILNLDRFERMRSKALETIRLLQQKEIVLKQRKEYCTSEITRLQSCETELLIIEESLKTFKQESDNLQEKLFSIQKSLQALVQQHAELLALYTHYEQAKNNYKQLEQEFRSLYPRYKEYVSLLQEPSLIFSEEQYQALQAEFQQYELKKLHMQNLMHKKIDYTHKLSSHELVVQQTIATQEIEKKNSLTLLERDIATLSKESENNNQIITACLERKKQYDEKLSRLAKTNPVPEIMLVLQTEQQLVERRITFLHNYTSQATQATSRLQEIEPKIRLLQDKHDPRCALCDQALSEEKQITLHDTFNREQNFYTHRLNRLKRLMCDLKDCITRQKAHITSLQNTIEIAQQSAQQESHYKYEIELLAHQTEIYTTKKNDSTQKKDALLKQHHSQHNDFIQWQSSIKHVLEQDNVRIEYIEHLKSTDQEIAHLEYDANYHQALCARLQEYSAQKNKLLEQEKLQFQLEQCRNAIFALIHRMKLQKTQLKDYQASLHQTTTVSHTINKLKCDEAELSQRMSLVQNQLQTVLVRKGSAEQQLEQCVQHRKQLIALEQEFAQLSQEIFDYQAISQALGKDGIQALYIEQALPEIEHEANQLLAKLTDNQTQIFIESLRDLKSGTTKETLDIKISDSWGIRSYELFSGGETFRIDLALRIALSKLLTKRAGTALQTLIIDEGFGSQDEEGLGRIMNALYRIQDDFAKIIIVSHLSSMKEQFPTHIVVHKTASGSILTVLEQG